MACGTPVVTSNVTAMPETAGDAGLLVDPFSVEQIADAIQRIVSDTSLRAQLQKKGLLDPPSFLGSAPPQEYRRCSPRLNGQSLASCWPAGLQYCRRSGIAPVQKFVSS